MRTDTANGLRPGWSLAVPLVTLPPMMALVMMASVVMAKADGAGEAVLRAHTHALSQAIGSRVQATAPRSGPGLELASGQAAVTLTDGLLYTAPAQDSRIIKRLAAGVPLVVTRTVGDGDWAEVLVAGQLGYLDAALIALAPPP